MDSPIDEVLRIVASIPESRVAITGDGALAGRLRDRIGRFDESRRPQAIVETTGTASELAAALSRVEDGGIVVLAGGSSEAVDVDLYVDLHRRGLVLIGVPGEERSDRHDADG